MVNDELAATAEKIVESLLSLESIEDIFLLDFYPGQCAAGGADGVALTRERFLLGEEFLAGE
jgi:hypothetical protein